VLDRLGLAAEAFGDFGQFMRLFHARPGFWGGIEWGSPRPEVPWLLRRVMLRRLRSDVLPQLPPKRYETLVVGLDGSLRGELDEAWREWDRLRPGREELPPFEAFSAVRRRLAESRIKAALEQVEGFEEAAEPLVVFSAHREPAVQIGARTGWGIITGDTDPPRRQEVVEEFQAAEGGGPAHRGGWAGPDPDPRPDGAVHRPGLGASEQPPGRGPRLPHRPGG
jgi:hypothetical protein